MSDAVKRTLLAMALLLTSVFGVTGCGSDEITQLEAKVDALEEQAGSRVKNAAPQAPDEITQLKTRVDALEEQAKSRAKTVAPEASAVSDVPSWGDCPTLGDLLDRLYLFDVIDGSNQKSQLLDILDRNFEWIDRRDYDTDLGDYNINLLEGFDRNERFDQLLGADAWDLYCDNAPEGDDVDGD